MYYIGLLVQPKHMAGRTDNSVKRSHSGLENCKGHNCRVAAIGIKEQLVYSGVVSRIVL